MGFLRDLIRWFMYGERRKNELSSKVVSEISAEVPEAKTLPVSHDSPTFDFLKDTTSADFIKELYSIRPLTQQFDRAREELIRELQRLAPPRKSILDIFKKAA